MKKFLLIILCMLLASVAHSQTYFEWRPDGKMLSREGNDYVIIPFDGKTKEVLYNDMLVSASSIFNNPTQTISSIGNQLISISAIQPVLWRVGGLLGAVEVNIHYIVKIHFKDNRIKVDAPYFSLLSFSSGGTQDDIEGWTRAQKFFNADGSPSNKKGKAEFCQDVNSSFNTLIYTLLNFNKTQDDW